MNVWTTIKKYSWGADSFMCLFVSLFSGIIVAWQYDAAHSYYSVVAQEKTIPYGDFFRSLHFYSSQLFFLLTTVHFVCIASDKYEKMSFGRWFMLSASLPVVILLLFTGYVLRGDATGEAAGVIAENITLSIPVAGDFLNSILFSIDSGGLKKVYANHLAGLPLLWLLFSWNHIRRCSIDWPRHTVLLVIMLLFSAVIAAPLEPHTLVVRHISGPWFFLGLQEMLRVIPVFWAGVGAPLFLFLLILMLYRQSYRKIAILLSFTWLVAYSILSVVGFYR